MYTFVGRDGTRVEDTSIPPRQCAIVSFATEFRSVDRIIHRHAASGYHWELASGFVGYVIAHSGHKIYVTQSLFKSRRSILGEPLGMQLQNYFRVGIKGTNCREILGAVLDLNHITSLQAQILSHLAAE